MQQTWMAGVHTSPQCLLQAPAPLLSDTHEHPTPPCLPSVSWLQPSPHLCLPLGLPLPQPVPGGCLTLHTALGHSLVAQDDPLDARSKKDNRADICQVVKESQEDAELCLPSQWVLGP